MYQMTRPEADQVAGGNAIIEFQKRCQTLAGVMGGSAAGLEISVSTTVTTDAGADVGVTAAISRLFSGGAGGDVGVKREVSDSFTGACPAPEDSVEDEPKANNEK